MKRLLAILMWLMCANAMYTQDFEMDNLCYSISSDSTVTVIRKFSGSYKGDIIIPESVSFKKREYTVTEIAGSAFNGYSITTVSIPPSIKKIRERAFGTSNLSAVYITDLKAWCEIEFAESSSFSDGKGNHYFSYANPLSCAQRLYINGEEVTNLEIPDSITNIGAYAFQNYTSLTSVTIASAKIEEGAFDRCSNLVNVFIGESVKSVNGFSNCPNLTNVTFGNSVSEIGKKAFENCVSLKNIDFPNSLTIIDNDAFRGCTNLTNIIFPDSLIYIGTSAFSGCHSLENIDLPNTLRYIINSAFYNCTELSPPMLPDSLEYLGGGAFSGCKPIRNLYIPSKVKSIESAFKMDSVETITVDIRNPYLDSRNNCNAVIETQTNTLLFGCKNSFVPDGVRHIGYQSLYGLAIDSIVIPSSVESISGRAFSMCDKLIYIEFQKSDSTLEIGEGAFVGCTSLKELFLPDNINIYEGRQFMNCTNLKTATLPSSLQTISEEMFYGCTSLTTVNLPDGLTQIGENAFYGCSLDTIRIPASVVKIDESAFMGCAATAKSISVDSGNTYYDSRNNCNMIIETAKNRVIQAGKEVFVTVPEGIESLGHYAFVNAYWLKYIVCPKTLKNIGENTFKGCSQLEKIIFRGHAPYALSVRQEKTSVNIREGQYEDIEVVIGKRWNSEKKVQPDAYFWLKFSLYMDEDIDELVEEIVAAVPSIESEKPTIRIFSSMLNVSNAEGLPVKVYSINGIKIYESANYSGEQIPLEKGMYIVQIDKKTEKIANW